MQAENSAGRGACRIAALMEGPALVSVSEPAGGDLPSNSSSTGRIVVDGDPVTGYRGTGDVDWFAVDLQAGVRYRFRISKRGSGTATISIILTHLNGTEVLTTSTLSTALDTEHTIATSGQHWLKIFGGSEFNYTATITET